MPIWDKIAKSLAPEVRTFLEKGVPLAGERTATVLKAAEKAFAGKPELLKQANDAVMPAAIHFRSQRLGQRPMKVAPDIFGQWLSDSEQLYPGVKAMQEAAKTGAPTWQKTHLPADLSPITTQASIKEAQDTIKRFYRPDDKADKAIRAKTREKLAGLVGRAKDQMAIKDMNRLLYLSPLSPTTKLDLTLGVSARIPSDVASAMTTIDANTKGLRAGWRSVAGWFPNVGDSRRFRKDMRQLWEDTLPIQDRYYTQREKLVELDAKIARLEEGGPKRLKLEAFREKMIGTKILPVYKDLQARRHAAFSKYFDQPDVRIALYREPETRPWVQKLMSPKEIKVAEWHKQLMDNARQRATELGIPVLKQDEEYITHLIHMVARGGKAKNKEIQAYIDRMLPKMVKFAHRTPGSLMFYPSVRTITDQYITGTSRKFGLTELMRKYEPIVEGPLKQWPRTQQYVTKYFKQFTEKVMDDQLFNKVASWATWWMYFSKTGMSLSVARKHAEKAISLAVTHPYDVLQAIAPTTKAGLQLAFQRFGAKPGSEARLIRNYLSSRSFFEAMAGFSAPEKERLGAMFNTVMAFPTSAVELTERGIAVMAGLGKSVRKGLSHDQTANAIWQIYIDQTFMGKADRFLWMRQPWQQLLGLFYYTPGRISDTTVKKVLMTLPKKHIQALKEDVLQTAWRFPTDAFGTPYVKNTLLFVGGIGLAEGLARHYLDSSLWKEMAFHLPFIREQGGEAQFYFWPIDVYNKGVKAGGGVTSPKPFLMALYDYLTTFPNWQRYARAYRGEKGPAIYGGQKAREIFALPSQEAEEREADRLRPVKEKRYERQRQRDREYREKQWPFGLGLQHLPPHIRRYLNE